MESFCVIPYSAQQSPFFIGVHDNNVEICSEREREMFAFSHILSPSHDLLANVNNKLLCSVHNSKDVMLILASPVCNTERKSSSVNCHTINSFSTTITTISCCRKQEKAINESSYIASISEVSTMITDICLDLFMRLFANIQKESACVTISMATVFSSGTIIDELQECEESVSSLAECMIKEINKANASTQWALILQRLQHRHAVRLRFLQKGTTRESKVEKVEQSHDKEETKESERWHKFHSTSVKTNQQSENRMSMERREFNESKKIPSICIISICIENSSTITIVDVDDDVSLLQLLTSLLRTDCHTSLSDNKFAMELGHEQHSLSVIDSNTINNNNSNNNNCINANVAATIQCLLFSNKNDNKYHSHHCTSSDLYDVIHVVVFANPLVSESGSRAVMRFASAIQSSLFIKYVARGNNYNSKSDNNSKEEKRANDENCKYVKADNNDNKNNNNNNNSNSSNLHVTSNCFIDTKGDVALPMRDARYHYSLPITESPSSSLSPPPFVTQLSSSPMKNVSFSTHCCNKDKSRQIANVARAGQLLSPSPFFCTSSSPSEEEEESSPSERESQRRLQVNKNNDIDDTNNETFNNRRRSKTHNANECSDINSDNLYQNFEQENSNNTHFGSNNDNIIDNKNEKKSLDDSNITYNKHKAQKIHTMEQSNIDKQESNVNVMTMPVKQKKMTNQNLELLISKTKRDLSEFKKKYTEESINASPESEEKQELNMGKMKSDKNIVNGKNVVSDLWHTHFMEHQLRLLEYERQQMKESKQTLEMNAAMRESELKMLSERVCMLEKALADNEYLSHKHNTLKKALANASNNNKEKNSSNIIANHSNFAKGDPFLYPSVINENKKVKDAQNVKENSSSIKGYNKQQCNMEEHKGSEHAAKSVLTVPSALPSIATKEAQHEYSEHYLHLRSPSQSSSSSSSSYTSPLTSPESNIESSQTPFNAVSVEPENEMTKAQERITAIGIHELRRRNAELEHKIAILESKIREKSLRNEELEFCDKNDNGDDNGGLATKTTTATINELADLENNGINTIRTSNGSINKNEWVQREREESELCEMHHSTEEIASSMLTSCRSLLSELNSSREKLEMHLLWNKHNVPSITSLSLQEEEQRNMKEKVNIALKLIDEHTRAFSALETAITVIVNLQVTAKQKGKSHLRTNTTRAGELSNLLAFEEERLRRIRSFLPIYDNLCIAAKYVQYRISENRLFTK